ncbi:MAG: YetF domain-containing protein [Pyrinomonadaceae bacterium]
MFFDDWFGLFRILIIGVLAYAVLIFWLRVSGKRTLSKWNAFDFVVTIALGSTLATVIVSKDVSFAEGVFALGLLIGLQFVITWLSVRFDWAENLVKAKPTLLFDKGEFLLEPMKRQRVAEAEVRMAIRAEGVAAVEEIEAVVLETDGSFSVIKKSATDSRSALADVS